VAIAKHLMEFFVMTASSGDQFIAWTSPNSSPAQVRSDVADAKDRLLFHTKVTYAPLAIWKDFHWTCTITSFAPPVQDRLE
jgi:hypothetical protein